MARVESDELKVASSTPARGKINWQSSQKDAKFLEAPRKMANFQNTIFFLGLIVFKLWE